MSLTTSEIAQLKKIMEIAEKLIGNAETSKPLRAGRIDGAGKTRRSGKDLATFRKMLKAERKAGVPVAKIAKKHGVSLSYIYQLG